MTKICMCGAERAVGLALIAFSVGIVIGMLCPLYILAIVELVLLAVLGYLCLFKW